MEVKSGGTSINELVNRNQVATDYKLKFETDNVVNEMEVDIKEILTINRVNDPKEKSIEYVRDDCNAVGVQRSLLLEIGTPYGGSVLVLHSYTVVDYRKHILIAGSGAFVC